MRSIELVGILTSFSVVEILEFIFFIRGEYVGVKV